MASSMQIFALLLPSFPLIAIYLVGVIFSSSKLGECRKAALLAMTGFGILLLGQLIRTGSNLMVLPAYRDSMSSPELANRLTALSLLGMFVTVAGTIFVLIAIFADRDKKPGIA